MKKLRRPALRTRLLGAVVVVLLVALAGLIGGFNVLLANRLSDEATNVARSRADARLATLTVKEGRLLVVEAPDDQAIDSLVWVFQRGEALESPQGISSEENQAAQEVSTGGARAVDHGRLRLVTLPIVADNQRFGSVVAAVALAPYRQTRHAALTASVGLGAGLLIVVALVSAWVLRAALRPVSRMTTQAAVWSEEDLEQRFGLGDPHDELTHLAATLDGLLDQVEASLLRERRLTAEVSHELRTPLAKVIVEAELVLRRPRDATHYKGALTRVVAHAHELEQILDTLLAGARQQSSRESEHADVGPILQSVKGNCDVLSKARRVAITVEDPSERLFVRAGADLAVRTLQPVVDNACRYARSAVNITARREGTAVIVTIADDGPGVTDDEQHRIFNPGERGSAALSDDGVGLGLPLALRLVRSVGGDISVTPGSGGGSFAVSLPGGRANVPRNGVGSTPATSST